MQFGREPLSRSGFAVSTDGQPGWVCGENPGHFELDGARVRPAGAVAPTVPDGRWDDDGGARR